MRRCFRYVMIGLVFIFSVDQTNYQSVKQKFVLQFTSNCSFHTNILGRPCPSLHVSLSVVSRLTNPAKNYLQWRQPYISITKSIFSKSEAVLCHRYTLVSSNTADSWWMQHPAAWTSKEGLEKTQTRKPATHPNACALEIPFSMDIRVLQLLNVAFYMATGVGFSAGARSGSKQRGV